LANRAGLRASLIETIAEMPLGISDLKVCSLLLFIVDRVWGYLNGGSVCELFLIRSHCDKRPQKQDKSSILEIAFEKLNFFLSAWNEILASGVSNDDAMELNTARVEGIALVFLCSTRAKVRLRAWETIDLVRCSALCVCMCVWCV
jgi:hypothetical protein